MGQTLVKILEKAKQVEDLPNIYVTPEGRVFKVQELAYSDNGNGYITFKHMVNNTPDTYIEKLLNYSVKIETIQKQWII